ncbi:MAG: M23 family metallopeptidase [Bacillota bacterium]
MESNRVMRLGRALRRGGLLWGVALFLLVFLSLTVRPPMREGTGKGSAEPVADEMAFEWALVAPAGDISPHPGAVGGAFIDGAAVAAGRDVATAHLQRMILSGAEISLRGTDGTPPHVTLILHPVVQATAEHAAPVAAVEPSPEPPAGPAIVEAPAAVSEEEDAAPQPREESEPEAEETPPVAPRGQLPEGVVALPVQGEIVTDFGWVRCATLDEWLFHPGVDISVPPGSEVRSVSDGQVLDVVDESASGVTVTVSSGDLVFVYGAMASAEVSPGDEVSEGDVVGVTGESPPRDAALPPHLHWEIRDREGQPLQLVVSSTGVAISR